MMATESTCSDCGAVQPANAPGGLCPRCLLNLGLDLSVVAAPLRSEDRPSRSSVRSPAGGHGPQASLASSSVSGLSRTPGILESLDASIGPVPRVLLRDGPVDEPRPVRPGSEEMPDRAGEPGRYQLLGEIARGGIGSILKGRDVDLGRDLAVKVLLEKHRDHPEMIRRFIEEAQIGGQLQHPGIVPVHELGRFPDGRLYIAMKLVRGRTLAALLEARPDPADDRARFLSVFEQVCQTMAYAHARGVIHRDLKPSNIMVGSFGEVQVMDWGLAKVLDQGGVADEARARRSRDDSGVVRTVRTGSEAGESRAGSVVGTPAYMAPEQARGAGDTLDERADVFGLGSILCEILTGQPAFTGRTSAELYQKAERAELGDARARLDGCGADAELAAMAHSCLAAVPKDRPRDAGVVLAGLTAYFAGVERRLRAADRARAQAEARAVEERRRRILTMALAVSVLATAAVSGGGWAWVVGQGAARAEAIRRAVNQALDDAARKSEKARTAPGGDATRWVEALEAARRAEALMPRGEGGTELRRRVRAVLAGIARERDRAESHEKDRRMVERLATIHDDMGVHLDWKKADAQYVAAFREYGVDVDALDPLEAGSRLAARPVAVELANALDQWTFLRRRGGPEPARRLVAVAKVADPDPWRNRLRDTLDRVPGSLDRLGPVDLAATADPERLPEASVTRLAFALSWLGETKTAVSLLRRAQRVHPGDFWLNFDLAAQLMRVGEFDDAIRFFSVAVSIRPQSAFALNMLGAALQGRGRLDDAVATFQQAIRTRPDDARAHVGLGVVLLDLGDSEKARAAFASAKAIEPEEGPVCFGIAEALLNRGEWDAAIAEFHEAVEREPDAAFCRDRLGKVLLDAGRIDQAIASFREAIRLDPRFPPTYSNLGRALLDRGEFEAALESFRRGHYGSVGTDRRSSSAQRLEQAERISALAARLPALLRGENRPSDAAGLADLARLCSIRQRFAASARFWTEAFAARPELAEEIQAEFRYQAARDAARAGCGQGQDDPPPDEPARRNLRHLALGWLEAELTTYTHRLENGRSPERISIPRRLGLWRIDPAFTPLRDPSAMNSLSESERHAWKALWSRAEALAKRAIRRGLASYPPPPHPP